MDCRLWMLAIATVCVAAVDAGGRAIRPSGRATGATMAPVGEAPHIVRIVAKDFGFEAPAEIPAGLTTIQIVNQGHEFHEAALLRLDSGRSYRDFVATISAPGKSPSWIVAAGGVIAASPGGDTSRVTVVLAPGHYVLLCPIAGKDHVQHMAKGMMQPLTVTTPTSGGDTQTAEPVPDLEIAMTEFAFTPSKPVVRGPHVVRIENRGQQNHEALIIKLGAGVALDDAFAWGAKQEGPPPFQMVGGLTAIAAGRHGYLRITFASGHYALLCFEDDPIDGKPHVAHGMIKEFSIP
jgi:hypothetical protein